MGFLDKISNLFGSNEKEINKLKPVVEKINSLEPEIKDLTDEQLKEKTAEFKKRLNNGETTDDILPEAYAVAREAARRILGQRAYDSQLLGAIVLHQGKIAEMKTGEGKTLTATMPVYLNAISGKGVHVVTVNDYLAKRDCNWMGSVYDALGLTTSCIVNQASFKYEANVIDREEVTIEMENLISINRPESYVADITYGTNNEFGFDYLRDNMVQTLKQKSQKPLHFAIVDEVDSILIDEARTPLIISAPDTESTKLYNQFARIIPLLKEKEDYEVDEKMKSVTLTEEGISKVEQQLGVGNIYEPGKINYVHHLEQSLKAQIIFHKDKDYVVKDGQVIIVDDFTGRLMEGRRYSDGLHQAIEAKESVEVQRESKTLATITFQNYFRMYNKLSGMTGTALTSAEEFQKVYKLECMEVPTNKPLVRKDLQDVVYKTEKGKFDAIVEKIKELNETGQPILVGTIQIEKSEYLSALLTRAGVKHNVLNAKQHEKEANIVIDAGKKGGVTIATNMAGRGTDIKLGEGVKALGGLFILGTERHEARRIDNQLRGRAGRQGDPGMSQFFVSLEDELMRRFGGDKLQSMMTTLKLPEDQPIQNPLISKIIESAQTKIEGYNFDIRKHVLDYDDVMNKQRETIYKKRNEILENKSLKNEFSDNIAQEIEVIVSTHLNEDGSFVLEDIISEIQAMFPLGEKETRQLKSISEDKSKDGAVKISSMTQFLIDIAKTYYNQKEKELGEEQMRRLEKLVLLQTIDTLWINHLDEIDHLREGIGLRGYGQRDPLIEYKKEAYYLFTALMDNIRATSVKMIYKAVPISPEEAMMMAKKKMDEKNMNFKGAEEGLSPFIGQNLEARTSGKEQAPSQKPLINKDKVGRNDPCPCGSGKKYKKCHGK